MRLGVALDGSLMSYGVIGFRWLSNYCCCDFMFFSVSGCVYV